MTELSEKKCIPCEGNIPAFKIEEIHKYLKKIDGWNVKKNMDENFFLEKIDDSSQENKILRIGIEKGGCAGLHYSMDYVSEISDGDEVVEQDGVTIVIDPKAILYLLGTEMDYVEEKFSAGFKFNNPNETSACGCGESVDITPISELEIK